MLYTTNDKRTLELVQNYYSYSSGFQQYHCNGYRYTGSGDFVVLRRYLWIQGTKKTFATETLSKHAIRKLVDRGIQRDKVWVKRPGLRREAVVRAIGVSGIKFMSIKDIALIPHNGCRLLKKRCI